MILHSNNKVTTFLKNPPKGGHSEIMRKAFLLDGAAQSVPQEESEEWSKYINGMYGFPFELSDGTFYGPFPTDPLLRCEIEFRRLKDHDRVAEFEIRIYSGFQENSILWAKWVWNEVLVSLKPLKGFTAREKMLFLKKEVSLPRPCLARFDSTDEGNIDPKDIKSCDWLAGTVARVYLADSEIKNYWSLPAQEALNWLAPRVAAKEMLAVQTGFHPSEIHIEDNGKNRLMAYSPRRPFNIIEIEYESNGKEFRVKKDPIEFPNLHPITSYWEKQFKITNSPVQALATAISFKFTKEMIFDDPEDFNGLEDKPCLYLANHQNFIEGFYFNMLISAYRKIPTLIIAKNDLQKKFPGKLDELFSTFPGSDVPRFLYFVNRNNGPEMLKTLIGLEKVINEHRQSILIHVEGRRAFSANEPVEKISSIILELSIKFDIPIVPVRFRGGLPLEPQGRKYNFPIGYGKQSIFIGRKISPQTLAPLSLGERNELVMNGINQLGGQFSEFPNPPDNDFEQKVNDWMDFFRL